MAPTPWSRRTHAKCLPQCSERDSARHLSTSCVNHTSECLLQRLAVGLAVSLLVRRCERQVGSLLAHLGRRPAEPAPQVPFSTRRHPSFPLPSSLPFASTTEEQADNPANQVRFFPFTWSLLPATLPSCVCVCGHVGGSSKQNRVGGVHTLSVVPLFFGRNKKGGKHKHKASNHCLYERGLELIPRRCKHSSTVRLPRSSTSGYRSNSQLPRIVWENIRVCFWEPPLPVPLYSLNIPSCVLWSFC